MVKGLDKFRDYFSDYTDQYVLIGGTACEVSFRKYDLDFRATRDLDIVLIVEAQTKEFGEKIWEFIKAGKYITDRKVMANRSSIALKNRKSQDIL